MMRGRVQNGMQKCLGVDEKDISVTILGVEAGSESLFPAWRNVLLCEAELGSWAVQRMHVHCLCTDILLLFHI